ncbi:hypothetical protein [Novosphingobium sp. MBES04]|uniref:hypothetical protein n=1 Tax=Novosphingobium sp. MBES04 TaxID=1206458 RepID=UPI00057CDA8E|nr:hypothetical protein [Novosphingobium sp. MBES04]GAM07124.1 hypothetical conserved protein [Novosphingobium sp. MBES04]
MHLPFPRADQARRALAVLTAGAAALLVAACFFAPGRFSSRLDVNADHSFAFRYTGELIMIPLKEEADKAAQPFEPEDCYDEDSFEERTCTEDEIAQQKEDWAAKKGSNADAARALLGGIDPSDPEAGHELARKLSRRQGWNKVAYKGGGVFDVDYAVSGRLDHDFVFPTFEGFPMANAFVQITPRKDGAVRINAPTFGPDATSSPAAGLIPGNLSGPSKDGGPAELADGTFTIHTDGKILANNTDEGPTTDGAMQVLTWAVNPRIPAAPTALLQLEP